MAAATHSALRGVQQLPFPARSPDLLPVEHVWDVIKRELALSPEPATINAKLRQQVQVALGILSQDNFRHLYNSFQARIHTCFAAIEVAHSVIMGLLGLNLSYTATMINFLHNNFQYNERFHESVAFFSPVVDIYVVHGPNK